MVLSLIQKRFNLFEARIIVGNLFIGRKVIFLVILLVRRCCSAVVFDSGKV